LKNFYPFVEKKYILLNYCISLQFQLTCRIDVGLQVNCCALPVYRLMQTALQVKNKQKSDARAIVNYRDCTGRILRRQV
jgi:hypothetical protein